MTLRYALLALIFAAFASPPANAQFIEQGPKLVGAGYLDTPHQATSVALSDDGNTALLGGPADTENTGAVWMFTRAAGAWTQAGRKFLGSGALGTASEGQAVSVSADGKTAIVGGPSDNGSTGCVGFCPATWGAAWMFTQSGGSWEQVAKLTEADFALAEFGSAVAMSGDGSTAIVGGPSAFSTGAAWVFTQSAAGWTQQGPPLIGTAMKLASEGQSVALSSDGNTALIGGPDDNNLGGAAWVFTRVEGVWGQQAKLVGTGATGVARQGWSVGLSGDGKMAVVGGWADASSTGATWVFHQDSSGTWTQQGNKLVGTGGQGQSQQGSAVAISRDGSTILVGAPNDNVVNTSDATGAAWVFKIDGNGNWNQVGSKLVGSGAVHSVVSGFPIGPSEGSSVALSADGSTALVGGPFDNAGIGAAWVFTESGATHFSVSAPASATAGTPVTVTVTALDANNNTFGAYSGTVHFTSTDAAALLPADAALVNGGGTFQVTFRTPGPQTITATDSAVSSLTGTSGAVAVSAAAIHVRVSAPATATAGVSFQFTVSAPGYSGTLHFTSSDPSAALPANATLTSGSGTFAATLNTAGSQSITATDTAVASLTGTSGAIAVSAASATPPAAISVTNSGSAYTFVFSDPRGYQNLNVVDILVNNFLDGRHACYFAYVVAQTTLVLVDDAGDAGGPYAGSQNSQCALTLVSANGSGNNLTLVVSLTWNPSFAGDKIFYLSAGDLAGNNSGWQPLGVVRVPGGAQATTTAVVSMSPNRGTGLGPTAFTFNFSDTVGFADLGVEDILINNALDGNHACYIAYSRPYNTLYLVNDNGDALLPGQSLAAAGSTNNSQCTVSWGSNAAAASGNNLALTLNLTFTAAFAGNRVIYVAARDVNEGNNTGWDSMGTWTPE